MHERFLQVASAPRQHRPHTSTRRFRQWQNLHRASVNNVTLCDPRAVMTGHLINNSSELDAKRHRHDSNLCAIPLQNSFLRCAFKPVLEVMLKMNALLQYFLFTGRWQ
eukprot:2968436-Amphidinium_carterae.1